MKNLRPLALALLCSLPALASAQSVTLYGVVDTGVEFVNHIGAASNSVSTSPPSGPLGY